MCYLWQRELIKLAAPKTRTAGASGKRKNSVTRKKNNATDGSSGRDKSSRGGRGATVDPTRHFIPVRRKPLGEYLQEYIKLESPLNLHSSLPSPVSNSSSSALSMSYAAAVETSVPLPSKYNVTITPRVKKSPKLSQIQSKNKIQRIKQVDTKFSIFDVEQPKPHIILVDPKQFRPDQTIKLVTKKARKPKKTKPNSQKKGRTSQLAACGSTHPPGKLVHKCIQYNDTPKESLTVKKKRLSASTVVSAPEIQLSEQPNKASPCIFSDDINYLGHHLQRLELILERRFGSVSSISSPQIVSQALQHFRDKPRLMELIHYDMNRFRRLQLESAALLAQNRSMLCRWMQYDELIS